MIKISITDLPNDRIGVVAPHAPEFVAAAKDLAGRWNPARELWTFDNRDRDRVAALCTYHFGTADSESETELATVRIDLTEAEVFSGENGSNNLNTARLGGYLLCRRRYRDEKVRLGAGVLKLSGQFESRGGSQANPGLDDVTGVVLEMRDLPAKWAEDFASRAGITVTRQPNADRDDVEPSGANRADLIHRREQLVAELDSIDAQLAALDLPATTD